MKKLIESLYHLLSSKSEEIKKFINDKTLGWNIGVKISIIVIILISPLITLMILSNKPLFFTALFWGLGEIGKFILVYILGLLAGLILVLLGIYICFIMVFLGIVLLYHLLFPAWLIVDGLLAVNSKKVLRMFWFKFVPIDEEDMF